MWKNIGRKLQSLAKVICWLGISLSLIKALRLWNQNSYLSGFFYLVIGSLASWIGSWSIYGLGLVVKYVENKNAASDQSAIPGYFDTSTGNQSDQAASPLQAKEAVHDDHEWTCRKCGAKNRETYSICYACGKSKD